MAYHSIILVPLLIVLACLNCCNGETLMVVLLHRHGSRTRLGKNDSTLEESASQLTAEGERQLFRAGSQARLRYLEKPSCTATGTCVQGTDWNTFDNSRMYIQSTALDRSLMSAYSFLLGLLPPTTSDSLASNFSGLLGMDSGVQPVPIYSRLATANDWILRGFGEQKCPQLLARQTALYQSDYFKAKEQETLELRTTLANALGTSIELKDIWNTFDIYNVQYDFGANTPAGGKALPIISNATWTQLIETANWMEWNRYGNNSQAQNLCGGALLGDIVTRILTGAAALLAIPSSVQPGPRYVQYSAHYATQLCLLSAINLTAADPANDPNAWIHKIPAYGAVLAFEAYTDKDGDLRVKLLLQDGQNATYRPIFLPCGTAGGDGSCLFTDFQSSTSSAVFSKVGEFCEACGNVTMTQCAAAKYMALLEANGNSPSNLSVCGGNAKGAARGQELSALRFFLAAAAMLLLSSLLMS